MFERILVVILVSGIAACGDRGGGVAVPPVREAAQSPQGASAQRVARDVATAPAAKPREAEQRAGSTPTALPSAPENAPVLRRRGVSLAPDGKGLVLEAPPTSREEAARAGLFRRMPEVGLPVRPEMQAP